MTALKNIHIALVGNYNPSTVAHVAIPIALNLAAKSLKTQVQISWIPSESLESQTTITLAKYHAIWCVPGSPYKSMRGALNAITFARTKQIPFMGTCGGFQHTLIEYAREVLLLPESDHLESNPDAAFPLIAPLACSLVGTKGMIFLKQGSQIEKIHNQNQITEIFNCNFGINLSYQHLFEKGSDLQITGIDQSNNARVVELKSHPFFIATLYQPERSALTENLHPLIKAFAEAALKLTICLLFLQYS